MFFSSPTFPSPGSLTRRFLLSTKIRLAFSILSLWVWLLLFIFHILWKFHWASRESWATVVTSTFWNKSEFFNNSFRVRTAWNSSSPGISFTRPSNGFANNCSWSVYRGVYVHISNEGFVSLWVWLCICSRFHYKAFPRALMRFLPFYADFNYSVAEVCVNRRIQPELLITPI